MHSEKRLTQQKINKTLSVISTRKSSTDSIEPKGKFKTEICKYYSMRLECPFAELVLHDLYSVVSHMENSSWDKNNRFQTNTRQNIVQNLNLRVTAPMANDVNSFTHIESIL